MEPHWKQNDRSGQVMENIRRFEGLWEKCTSSAVGINACDQFDHFIIGKLKYIPVKDGLELFS